MIQVLKNKYKAWVQTYKYYAKCLEDTDKIERQIHDTYYSHLLFDYILNARKTLRQKRRLKTLFFIIIMSIFVLTFFCFYKSLQDITNIVKNASNQNGALQNSQTIIEILTIIVPPLLSVIVAFIKIPKIIAKYLFNIKEDEYMTSIIENLQNYDKSIYSISIENKIESQLEGRDMDNDRMAQDFPGENTG